MTTNLPATVQLSTLSQEIGALTDQLRRPSAEDIASGIAWLMDGGMQYPPSIAEDKAIDEYVLVLKDIPSCGLRKALTKLKRGQYENVTIDFIPIPAKLAALSTTEASGVIDQLSRLKSRKETLEDLAGEKPRSQTTTRNDYPDGYVPPSVMAMRKKYEGRRVLAEGIEMGAFKPKEWPPGTIFVAILGTVYAPDETKKKEPPAYRQHLKSREPARSFHEPDQDRNQEAAE